MGKPILWPSERVQQDSTNRFVSDNQIINWDNKLDNITITDWNNAISSGLYNSAIGENSPVSNAPVSGYVMSMGNLIIQQVYPQDSSADELIYYIRKGFKNGSTITWSKWFIINLLMEEEEEPDTLTRVIKGFDANQNMNLFRELIPSTATSIVFTDIKAPSSATIIDADADGDGGVVAWLDGTTMYVSTQSSGRKVQGNKNSFRMFLNKSNISSIDLSNFDTSKVENMGSLFQYLYNLTSLDVSNFDTSKVTDMSGMFNNCSGLTTLDVSNWDTSNVTTMSAMFASCSFTQFDLSKINLSNVTNLQRLFDGCDDLISINATNINISKVTNIYQIFNYCKSLTLLDLSGWDTSSLLNMQSAFSYCTNLTSINLTGWNTNNVTDMTRLFNQSSKLSSIKVGDKFKWVGTLSNIELSGTWKDETGNTYTSSSTFPSNVAHTYTKVS